MDTISRIRETTGLIADSGARKVNVTNRSPTDYLSLISQQLSPEQRVVLAALRLDHAQDDLLRDLLRGGVDWDEVEKYSLRHGVMPLVYQRLEELAGAGERRSEGAREGECEGTDDGPPQCLTSSVPPSHRHLFISNARRNLLLAERLVGLLELFEDAGIPAIPLKGPVLAVQAYGDLSMRQMTDLDVLIRREDFRRAYELLITAGYRPDYDVTPKRERWLLRTEKEIHLRGQGSDLDLKWGFSSAYLNVLPFDLETAAFWTRLAGVEVDGRRIRALSPEDTLLTLIVHGTGHAWSRLKWLADVAHLAAGHACLDWRAVAARSREAHALEIAAIALHLMEELFGPVLPPSAADLFPASPATRGLVARLVTSIPSSGEDLREFRAAVTRIQPARPFLPHLRYRLALLFSPCQLEWTLLDLPEPFYPLYYLLRPARLAAVRLRRALGR